MLDELIKNAKGVIADEEARLEPAIGAGKGQKIHTQLYWRCECGEVGGRLRLDLQCRHCGATPKVRAK